MSIPNEIRLMNVKNNWLIINFNQTSIYKMEENFYRVVQRRAFLRFSVTQRCSKYIVFSHNEADTLMLAGQFTDSVFCSAQITIIHCMDNPCIIHAKHR